MTSPSFAIGCLGEVMLELVPTEGTQASLGVAGDTYNTAVYLRHVAPHIPVHYITGVGRDGFSARILRHMDSFGIGRTRVFRHPTRGPGLYAIETDPSGERSFTYWRNASAARCLGDPDTPDISELLEGLTHVFLSGISLAILPQTNRDRLFAALESYRADGGAVAFDSNYRPHLWEDPQLARRETERAWRLCDIAMPSIDDEHALFEEKSEAETLQRFLTYDISHGVLKRAAEGPLGFDGITIDHPDEPIRVVDTTAAGDSFNAAFLAAILQGQCDEAAMTAGHALACRVIAERGAIIFSQEEIA